MAGDFITLDITPMEEYSIPIDSMYDLLKVRLQAYPFIMQLRRHFGVEPNGTSLKVDWFPHDCGVYVEVICCYDDNDQIGKDYALTIADNPPDHWDDIAIKELAEIERFLEEEDIEFYFDLLWWIEEPIIPQLNELKSTRDNHLFRENKDNLFNEQRRNA
jgi:hypothetical protein